MHPTVILQWWVLTGGCLKHIGHPVSLCARAIFKTLLLVNIGRRFTCKTVQALSYGLTISLRAKAFETTFDFFFFFFWYGVSQCKVQYFVLYQRLHLSTALQTFELKNEKPPISKPTLHGFAFEKCTPSPMSL